MKLKGICDGGVRGLKWLWGRSIGERGLHNTLSSRRSNDQKSRKIQQARKVCRRPSHSKTWEQRIDGNYSSILRHERPLQGGEVEEQLPLCCTEHRQPRSYTRQVEAG